MYKPKSLTVFSLAIGDVFLALFSMVVYTKYLFEDDFFENHCHLFITAGVYRFYLNTFVYGIGLIVLGLEIILHHRISCLSKLYQVVCSMVASSIPWILGLIIILPLALANIDVNHCRSTSSRDQLKNLLVVSIIIPASGAIITSVLTIVFVKCGVKVLNHQAVSNNPENRVTVMVQNTAYVNNLNVHQHEPIPTEPDNQHLQPLMLADSNQAQHPHCLQEFYNLPITQPCALPTRPQYTRNRGLFLADPTPMASIVTSEDVSSISKHKVFRLLIVSFVYFMLVAPLAFDEFVHLMKKTDKKSESAVVDVLLPLSWLPVIRCFITPVIMYDYSDS
ncbi:unnamed protein product [Lymnaea stagnalis]|uniref:G-protein coupled receptors family 1 profile domain-containing protein n=1 Tax=Lymnaea stagnalis TaxID=6523 RepID=A0AAV2IRT0_LYMST